MTTLSATGVETGALTTMKVLGYFAVLVAFGWWASKVAGGKGHNQWLGFGLGYLLGPLGVVICYRLARKTPTHSAASELSQATLATGSPAAAQSVSASVISAGVDPRPERTLATAAISSNIRGKVVKATAQVDTGARHVWSLLTDVEAWATWACLFQMNIDPDWRVGAALTWRSAPGASLTFGKVDKLVPEQALTIGSDDGEIEWRIEADGVATRVSVEWNLDKSSILGPNMERYQRRLEAWLLALKSRAEQTGVRPAAGPRAHPDLVVESAIEIGRTPAEVWAIFSRPESWERWYGGGMKSVEPGWQREAIVRWNLGAPSWIREIEPARLVVMVSDGGVQTTWTFSESSSRTRVNVAVDYSNTTLLVTDRPGQENRWREWLGRLKRLVETAEAPTAQ